MMMPISSEKVQELLGLSSPLKPSLVPYVEDWAARCGEEYVKKHRKLLLDCLAYIDEM
jgi:hypothetical protein